MMTIWVARAEDVISRRIGDEMVVLKNTADSAHILNKTAAAVWELCDGERSLDEIAERICDRFEVSFEEARADIEEIIGRLIQVGILAQSAEPAVEKEDSQTI
jgi:hypothetical protein